jgi:hypothetical protein
MSYLLFLHQDPSGNEADMAMIALGFVAFFCTLRWQGALTGPEQSFQQWRSTEEKP